ncbi:serine carboxypeptidase-like protein 16, partial [Tanacetum coccineum]
LLALMVYQGPLSFKVDNDIENLTLTLNPYSWTKLANIIFMDVPAGVGYFYGETNEASVSNDPNMVTQATNFVKKVTANITGYVDYFGQFTSEQFPEDIAQMPTVLDGHYDADANVKDMSIDKFSVSSRGKELLKAASVKISHDAVQPFSPVNDIERTPIFLNQHAMDRYIKAEHITHFHGGMDDPILVHLAWHKEPVIFEFTINGGEKLDVQIDGLVIQKHFEENKKLNVSFAVSLVDQRKALQQEIASKLNNNHVSVLEQVAFVGLSAESLGSSVKKLPIRALI